MNFYSALGRAILGAATFSEEGTNELQTRFLNTHIGVRTDDALTVVLVNNISAEGPRKVQVTGMSVHPRVLEWVPFSKIMMEDDIHYFPPYPGYRNLERTMVYYDVLPQRIRTRGLTNDLTHLYFPVQHGLRNERNGLTSAEVVSAIYNPKFYKPEEAIALVTKKKMHACAFSKNFGIGLGNGYGITGYVIFHNRNIAGYFDKDSGTVVLPQSMHYLKSELSKYIPCSLD